jgi:hypothetical protein
VPPASTIVEALLRYAELVARARRPRRLPLQHLQNRLRPL